MLKKASLVLADGNNDDFAYRVKNFSYKGSDESVKMGPVIESVTIKTINFKSLSKLRGKTEKILKRGNVSLVDSIVFPVLEIPYQKGNYYITAADNAFVMANDFFLRPKDTDFMRKHLIEREQYFNYIRSKDPDPMNVGQQDNTDSQDYQLYLELLGTYRKIMIGEDVKEVEDYYKMLKALFYLRQKSHKLRYGEYAEQLVKKYGK